MLISFFIMVPDSFTITPKTTTPDETKEKYNMKDANTHKYTPMQLFWKNLIGF